MVLGLSHLQILEYTQNHGGGNVGTAQTIASAHDEGSILHAIEGILHVQQQRFAVAAGFLGAVQYGNALAACRHGLQQVLHREGTIQVYAHHTVLLAVGVSMVNSLACSLGGRTHQDDDFLCILCAIICEQVILAACTLADCGHVLLHDGRNGIVVAVAALAVSEEGLGVLCHTLCHGAFGCQCT